MTKFIPMTKQKIFNKVWIALNTQGQPSLGKGQCCYRGQDGLKCAAGHLIPDELYTPGLENLSSLALGPIWKDTGVLKHIEFIRELQIAHDAPSGYSDWILRWRSYMIALAAKHDLSVPAQTSG